MADGVGPEGHRDEVQAAGGVVLRDSPAGRQVLIIHRPQYDDWSFPKGKVDPGESSEQAALREVVEETALVCSLGTELRAIHYTDARGRSKQVRYWLMEVESGDVEQHVADAEVDRCEWVSPGEARSRLTYERDRSLLDTVFDPDSGTESSPVASRN